MEYSETGRRQEILTVLAILIVVSVIVAAATLAVHHKQTSALGVVQTAAPATSGGTSSQAGTSRYKDGQYTVTTSYMTPGGDEQMLFSVTLSGGKVTQTAATPEANDPTSSEYQFIFADSYKSQVVGQRIDGLRLDRVSGASLTTQGFNDAIEQIRRAAQS